MRKILLIMLIVAIYVACKKDGGGSGKKRYLSKVFVNDLLSEEFIYSSDKKAIRRNRYNTSGGTSVFAQFRIYEYENGVLTRMLQYNKEGELADKKVLSYNASNKIARLDLYGKDELLDWYYTYEYDNNQQVSKVNSYSLNPVKKQGEKIFQYSPGNILVSLRRYYLSLGNMVLSDSAHFSSDRSIPDHWDFYEELMVDFPADRTLEGIVANNYFYHELAVGPSKTTHAFTQKTYNNQGYLVSQQYKSDVDAGMGIVTTNYNLKYEYIE